MLTFYIVLVSFGTVAASTFGYLKYRAYIALAKHIVDTLGKDGLSRLGVVEPPGPSPSNSLPRRASSALKAGQDSSDPARRVATGRPPGRTPGAGASGRGGA
jgi:hypothetical protein